MENAGAINPIHPQPTDISNSEGDASASALNHSVSSAGETLAKVHDNQPDRADEQPGTPYLLKSSGIPKSTRAPMSLPTAQI